MRKLKTLTVLTILHLVAIGATGHLTLSAEAVHCHISCAGGSSVGCGCSGDECGCQCWGEANAGCSCWCASGCAVGVDCPPIVP